MERIPLEDEFYDVIAKAQLGLNLNDQTLAGMAGISVEDLAAVKKGHFDELVVRKLAPVLKLRTTPLIELARGTWYPQQTGDLPGLARFISHAEDMTVNSYLAWDDQTSNGVCFDTGTDASDMLRFAAERKIRIQMLLVTHTHSDHIAALDRLCALTDARAFVSKKEALDNTITFQPGHDFRAGKLKIHSRSTPGHSRGGVSYVIEGLDRPVVVVGDALFAGSMGKGFYSYEEALRSNCQNILTLPGETVVCPGHGPLTTVAEEREHNPFFAV